MPTTSADYPALSIDARARIRRLIAAILVLQDSQLTADDILAVHPRDGFRWRERIIDRRLIRLRNLWLDLASPVTTAEEVVEELHAIAEAIAENAHEEAEGLARASGLR